MAGKSKKEGEVKEKKTKTKNEEGEVKEKKKTAKVKKEEGEVKEKKKTAKVKKEDAPVKEKKAKTKKEGEVKEKKAKNEEGEVKEKKKTTKVKKEEGVKEKKAKTKKEGEVKEKGKKIITDCDITVLVNIAEYTKIANHERKFVVKPKGKGKGDLDKIDIGDKLKIRVAKEEDKEKYITTDVTGKALFKSYGDFLKNYKYRKAPFESKKYLEAVAKAYEGKEVWKIDFDLAIISFNNYNGRDDQ